MSPSSSADDASLLSALTTLYPAACLLAGPDAAPDLLLRVYQRAAERPPTERPDNEEQWLLRLLREACATSDEAGPQTPDAGERTNETSPSSDDTDPLRRDVAETILQDALPVAVAACPLEARSSLATAALEPDENAPSDLSLSDLSLPDADAPTALRRALNDVLPQAQYALVDDAFSDADLRAATRSWLTAHFSPMPRSLRPRVQSTLAAARSRSPATSPSSSGSAQAPEDAASDASPSWRPRTLVLTLLGALLLAGGAGAAYVLQPGASSSPPPERPDLISFSAAQAPGLSVAKPTSSAGAAETHIASTWNRRVRVPTIAGAALQGVGRVAAENGGPGVPVLLYSDSTTSARIAAFVYTYALVDDLQAAAPLNTQVRSQLAERNRPVAQTRDSASGLLWRNRDDIFVAVSPSLSADSLRPRLRP